MSKDIDDFTSQLTHHSSNILLLDAPRRVIYGVIIGLALDVGWRVLSQFEPTIPKMDAYNFVKISTCLMIISTACELMFKRQRMSQKHEEMFAVVEKAREMGLPDENINLQLKNICELAQKELHADNVVYTKPMDAQ